MMDLRSKVSTNNLHALRLLEESFPAIKDNFNIYWTIGKGHFGLVLLGRLKSKKSSEWYAIKLLGSNNRSKDVERELQYLKMLKGHKNIVQYVKDINCKGNTAIITKYFRGESFRHTFRHFSPHDIQVFMKNLLRALAEVHSFGITHGDIKPGNFLFDMKTKKFVLIDFGMARPIGSKLLDMGTVGFIAPESILAYEKSTTAIDIWSAGCIFISLLSGIYPFFQTDGREAFKELSVVFGTKEVKSFAKTLGKGDFMKDTLKLFERKKPLSLRKICVLFRQHKLFHKWCCLSDKCQDCEQYRMFCICQTCCNTDFDILRDVPDYFPDSTYDLLGRMLKLNPTDRISAKEALNHRFFFEYLESGKSHCKSSGRHFKGIINSLTQNLKRSTFRSSKHSDI